MEQKTVQNKNLEKMKFIFYVRRALSRLGLNCAPDGRYIKGELVIKVRDDALDRRDKRVKFKSHGLNMISKKYELVSLDQLCRDGCGKILTGLYRLNFKNKDLDLNRLAAEYEQDETCLFATPNFMISPATDNGFINGNN